MNLITLYYPPETEGIGKENVLTPLASKDDPSTYISLLVFQPNVAWFVSLDTIHFKLNGRMTIRDGMCRKHVREQKTNKAVTIFLGTHITAD